MLANSKYNNSCNVIIFSSLKLLLLDTYFPSSIIGFLIFPLVWVFLSLVLHFSSCFHHNDFRQFLYAIIREYCLLLPVLWSTVCLVWVWTPWRMRIFQMKRDYRKRHQWRPLWYLHPAIPLHIVRHSRQCLGTCCPYVWAPISAFSTPQFVLVASVAPIPSCPAESTTSRGCWMNAAALLILMLHRPLHFENGSK